MNEAQVLIDLVVVAGAAVVLPVALGRWAGAWLGVAASTALAVAVGPGPVGLMLALPWLVLASAATVQGAARALHPGRPALDRVADLAAPGFALVAGAALVVSCGDLPWFSYGEPITRLAVVHFTFAGTATTVIAAALRPGWLRTVGLGLAMGAPPVVASGFATGAALPQVGGAVLMTGAAYAVAAGHLAEAWPGRSSTVGRLLLVSGLSVWAPMVLAVTWALAVHTGGPALSIPDMVRTHGSANAFGFVGCGLAARWLAAHEVRPRRRAPASTTTATTAATRRPVEVGL